MAQTIYYECPRCGEENSTREGEICPDCFRRETEDSIAAFGGDLE